MSLVLPLSRLFGDADFGLSKTLLAGRAFAFTSRVERSCEPEASVTNGKSGDSRLEVVTACCRSGQVNIS